MNYNPAQLYTYDHHQVYQYHNSNSVDFVSTNDQIDPNSQLMPTYVTPIHPQTTDPSTVGSSYLSVYDPNCQAYLTQLPQNFNASIYNLPNNTNALNYPYAYSTTDNTYNNFNVDYFRSLCNYNQMRSAYVSQQIQIMSNTQINPVENNYTENLNEPITNVPLQNKEIPKNITGKPLTNIKHINYFDTNNKINNLSYKNNPDNNRRLFKSLRNKSKSTIINNKISGHIISNNDTMKNSKSSSLLNNYGNNELNDDMGYDSSSMSDQQSVELLITNLDYNINAKEWKKLLYNQFQNCIKRVISVYIQTQPDGSNCAIIRVQSMEDARLAISQFHRKKIGYKRIQVNLVNNSFSVAPSNIKQEVASLLKSVAGYSLSVFKFMELYEKRYHRNISISDFYKMRDFVEIKDVGGNQNGKIISLTNTAINYVTQSGSINESCQSFESPVCLTHCKEGSDEYIGIIDSSILPNVEILLSIFKDQVYKILQSHNGTVPLMSFLACYKAEFNDIRVLKSQNLNINSDKDSGCETNLETFHHFTNGDNMYNNKQDDMNGKFTAVSNTLSEGVPLEHLLTCIPGIKISTAVGGIRKILWDEKKDSSNKSQLDTNSTSTQNNLQINNGIGGVLVDRLHQFSREIVDLMKHQSGCRMLLSKFIPTYHHHFGKQCRVADYGFSKLHELIDALPHVVHVIGSGYVRMLYLSHKVQVRRFTNELMKVLKSQSAKTCSLNEYDQLYKQLFNKDFQATDYGVCFIEDLIEEIPENTIEISNQPPIQTNTEISFNETTSSMNESVSTTNSTVYISMPKRIQTQEEKDRTEQFAVEVIDLLKQSPRCRLPFNKFIPSYHHHFSRQCKVAEYGFTKLIELLDAVPNVVQIIEEHGEKYVILTRNEIMKVFAEQTLMMLEKSYKKCINLHDFPNVYLKTQGYALNLEDFVVNSLVQLIIKIPKIAKLQNFSYSSQEKYSTDLQLTEPIKSADDNQLPVAISKCEIANASLSSMDHINTNRNQSDTFICLADRNHIKYLAHKIILVLLEIPNGCLPESQLVDKYRMKFRENPNIQLVPTELSDFIEISNDSEAMIKLKPILLLARDLRDILRYNQGKMPLIQFESACEQHFGAPLQPQNYGYSSLFSLLQACNFVVSIKGRGSRAMIILNQDFINKIAYRMAYNIDYISNNENDDLKSIKSIPTTFPTVNNENYENYKMIDTFQKDSSQYTNSAYSTCCYEQIQNDPYAITATYPNNNTMSSYSLYPNVYSANPYSLNHQATTAHHPYFNLATASANTTPVAPYYSHPNAWITNTNPIAQATTPTSSTCSANSVLGSSRTNSVNPSAWFMTPQHQFPATNMSNPTSQLPIQNHIKSLLNHVPNNSAHLQYINPSQDQKQIDELVETLAYDNSTAAINPPAALINIHAQAPPPHHLTPTQQWFNYAFHHQQQALLPTAQILPISCTANNASLQATTTSSVVSTVASPIITTPIISITSANPTLSISSTINTTKMNETQQPFDQMVNGMLNTTAIVSQNQNSSKIDSYQNSPDIQNGDDNNNYLNS